MMLRKSIVKPSVSIICLILTLILGIVGNYVWVTFRTGSGEIIIRKFNFLSATIFGYGLYFPLIVIIITMSLLLLSILKLLRSSAKIRFKNLVILVVIDIVCIILPILLGMQMLNMGIVCMLVLLICNLISSLLKLNDENLSTKGQA
ncbi:MAG: hypothetical protein ACLU1X_06425 [Peptoniphilus grossensis]